MLELSVIVATHPRTTTLQACLSALCDQTATNFEVVVVLDGFSDDLRSMLAHIATSYPLRVIWQPFTGVAAAFNKGVETARGRYCVFLRDDTVADPGLLVEHMQFQHEHHNGVGLGQLSYTLPRRASRFARHVAAWHSERAAEIQQDMRAPSLMDCRSNNMSVSRAVFQHAGGFAVDLPYSYDIELGYRLEQQGVSWGYLPRAKARQEYRKRVWNIVADAQQAGSDSIKLYQHHPAMLPHLPLGAFNQTSLRAQVGRRFLLAIGAPVWLLAFVGLVLRQPRKASAWWQFLYEYCYWHGVRRAVAHRDMWRRLTSGTAILMYHACGQSSEPPSTYVIPARRFARQMAWLKWTRRNVLSLNEFLGYRYAHRLPPAGSVVITFDDGYADNHTLAYPILRKYGFAATIFVVSNAVGTTNQWNTTGALAGRPLVSWGDIKAMLGGGILIGAHTRSHALLAALPTQQAQDEVEGAQADLERELGVPIRTFAYPGGKHDAASSMLVRRTFGGACSSHAGLNDPATPLHLLRRVEMRGNDTSLVNFTLALWLGRTHPLSALWTDR